MDETPRTPEQLIQTWENGHEAYNQLYMLVLCLRQILDENKGVISQYTDEDLDDLNTQLQIAINSCIFIMQNKMAEEYLGKKVNQMEYWDFAHNQILEKVLKLHPSLLTIIYYFFTPSLEIPPTQESLLSTINILNKDPEVKFVIDTVCPIVEDYIWILNEPT